MIALATAGGLLMPRDGKSDLRAACQARPAATLILDEALSETKTAVARIALPRRCGFEDMFTSNVKVLAGRGCGQAAAHDQRPSHSSYRSVAARPLNPFGRARLAPLPAVPSYRRAAASPLARQRFFNGQQNAHRREPPGGNPGGGPARQSC